MAVAALIIVRTEVITPLRVSSDSMLPTVHAHDVVLVDRLGIGAIRRNDLVVFHSPAGGALLLKRVVGVGGDDVAIRDGVLYVNDILVREPYVDQRQIDGTYFGPVTVPADDLFVFGDNRANSIDSRDYGPVPVDSVLGRVVFRF